MFTLFAATMLTGAFVACLIWRNTALLALLGAANVMWVAENGPVEGPVLLSISSQHGVTLADLLTPVTLVLAGYLRLRREPRPCREARSSARG